MMLNANEATRFFKRSALAIAIPFTILSVSGCGEQAIAKTAAIPTLPEVATAEAKSIEIMPEHEFTAKTEAIQVAQVRPRIPTFITSKNFKSGQIVKKGDLLYTLDDRAIKASLGQAKAALQQAEANSALAKLNFDRNEELLPSKAISQAQYDASATAYDIAKASVQVAEAAVDAAKVKLTYTKIYAPFTGKIDDLQHAVGDSVGPTSYDSGLPLYALVQLNPIYASVNVSQSTYSKLMDAKATIQQKGVQVPEMDIAMEMAGDITYSEKGQFSHWIAKASDQTGTINAKIIFNNDNYTLVPGQNVDLDITVKTPIQRIVVPQKAIGQDQQSKYVMLVDDTNTVHKQRIETGIRVKDLWVVTEGLNNGDKVVVTGLQRIHNESKVAFIADNSSK